MKRKKRENRKKKDRKKKKESWMKEKWFWVKIWKILMWLSEILGVIRPLMEASCWLESKEAIREKDSSWSWKGTQRNVSVGFDHRHPSIFIAPMGWREVIKDPSTKRRIGHSILNFGSCWSQLFKSFLQSLQ